MGLYTHKHTRAGILQRRCECVPPQGEHTPSLTDGAAPRLPQHVKDKVSKGQSVPVLRAAGDKGLAG